MRRAQRLLALPALVAMCVATTAVGSGVTSSGAAVLDARPPSVGDAALPSSGCSEPHASATAEQTIEVGSETRHYQLSVPAVNARATPAPLVVLLHGLGQQGATIAAASGLADAGRRRGVIVVAPDAGSPNGLWQPTAGSADDSFVDDLIARTEDTQCVDRKRVAIVGFSAGAAFASAYACRNQNRIAALVTASFEFPGSCAQPEPVLAFHGTSDPIVPYGGSTTGNGLGGPGTLANMAQWARTNGCATKPSTTTVNERVTRTTWRLCRNGADTELITVVGGGHAWPDPSISVDPPGSKQPTNGTGVALQFLRVHPLAVGRRLLSFCSAAKSLLGLTSQVAVTGMPDLAANTALVAGRARLLELARSDTEREAAMHLADAALEATEARQPSEQAVSAQASARTTIARTCP